MERNWLIYLVMVLTWPVVYFLWSILYSLITAPIFLAPKKREKPPGPQPGAADIFEVLGAAASQVACLAAGQAVLGLWGREAGGELVLIYAAWAFLMLITRGPMIGLPGRHGILPDALGLAAGLVVGYLILF